ncbi:hypothetical protein [Pseudomonas nitroreducens]|uniref:hypothetical protein n=1 Tax=Pseudomonas nitroreducens TaxID=46680 RepID=UPI003800C3B7
MNNWQSKLFSPLAILITVIIVVLSIIGGIRSFTPVPVWDMWGPFVGAYKLSDPGGLSGLFSLHNEHRIIISRLLFWVDVYLFRGSTIFLITLNYTLAATAAWTLALIARESSVYKQDRSTSLTLVLLATSLCFAWMQRENFTWAFQSQFFAAQLIPLVALYLLYKAAQPSANSNSYYWSACIAGILCAGTMANGVIALALMAVVSFVFGMRRWQSVVLIALSAAVSLAYFHNFHTPGSHGSLSKTLIHQPLDALHYVMLYIGSPAYFITGNSLVATWAGLFILLSSIFFSVQTFRHRRHDYLIILLLTYLLYIGGSALGTAGGRLVFGLDQALSSRYTTPAIMAWATLAIIFFHYFHDHKKFTFKAFAVLLMLSLVPQQWTALRNKEADSHQKLVAALAAELQVRDEKQIKYIFPSADYVLKASDVPSRLNYTIFGDSRIRDAREEITTQASSQLIATPRCQGHLDRIEEVAGAPDYLSVHGWIFNPMNATIPTTVRILDKRGVIVGRVLTGLPRNDVSKKISRKARYSGFDGYLTQSALRGKLTLVSDENGGCHIDGLLQDSIFTARPSSFAAPDRFASTEAIQQQTGWSKQADAGPNTNGFNVVRTLASESKSSKKELVLTLRKGESIYYRSGGRASNRVFVDGYTDEFSNGLPVAREWIILKFDQRSLPDSFTLRLTNSGDSSDDWGAVALRSTGDVVAQRSD